ncbi:MAG: beta-N-acetylhexosaminidase [Myxococcales bacterium]|nr:beta-N-acetylhexosaminidase [Myxococcales bacterium]
MSELRNLKRRIGQRIIIGFDGPKVPQEVLRLDEEWGLGGFILFKRNLQSFEQVLDLTENLWPMGGGVPPFIGIDQEGGAVHRLPKPFTVFPDMAHLGQVGSVSLAYEVGAVIGREMTAAGFNTNFAPVLDVNTNPQNPVIGRRAISTKPQQVASLGRAVIRGLHDNSVVACGKHFPGHGDTRQDSHEELAYSDADLERLRAVELIPFHAQFHKAPNLDLLMTAHVMFPNVDSSYPATLSRVIMHDLLRTELGYKGLVVTDDLEMRAITDHYTMADVAILGLEAGIDLFMVCQTIDKQVELLEALLHQAETGDYPKQSWERGCQRVRDLKARHLRVIRSIDRAHVREVVGNREHQRIARRLNDGK